MMTAPTVNAGAFSSTRAACLTSFRNPLIRNPRVRQSAQALQSSCHPRSLESVPEAGFGACPLLGAPSRKRTAGRSESNLLARRTDVGGAGRSFLDRREDG